MDNFDASVALATISELRAQRDLYLQQVNEMRVFIRSVPTLISRARLDAKLGQPTKFNYSLLGLLCAERLPSKRSASSDESSLPSSFPSTQTKSTNVTSSPS